MLPLPSALCCLCPQVCGADEDSKQGLGSSCQGGGGGGSSSGGPVIGLADYEVDEEESDVDDEDFNPEADSSSGDDGGHRRAARKGHAPAKRKREADEGGDGVEPSSRGARGGPSPWGGEEEGGWVGVRWWVGEAHHVRWWVGGAHHVRWWVGGAHHVRWWVGGAHHVRFRWRTGGWGASCQLVSWLR